MTNGLYCGYDHSSIKNNIFCKNSFIYGSNNDNYKEGLPGWQGNDIIILQYDSNLSILSFSKQNDNDKLDSYIKNLPKHVAFYWFVGQARWEKMSLTVV